MAVQRSSPIANRPRRMTALPLIDERLSIRARLALWYAGFLLVTLLAFSLVVYTAAQNQLIGAVQSDIQYRAGAIAAALQRIQYAANGAQSVIPMPGAASVSTPTVVTSPSADNATPTPFPTPNAATSAAIQNRIKLIVPHVLGRLDLGFEVLDDRERPLSYAPSLDGVGLPRDDAVIQAVLHGAPATSYTVRANGSTLAVYVQPITLDVMSGSSIAGTTTPPTAGAESDTRIITPRIAGVVLVARPLDDVSATLDTLGHLLIFGDLIAVLFVSLGGWLIAKAGLRPLAAMTRTARAIATHAHPAALGARVNYRGPRDDVGTLAATFNEMLESIEQATIAQRRFVADASHELRAPITTIKSTLEFLLRRAPADLPADERRAMLEDAFAEAQRMAALIGELLLLARADAATGNVAGNHETWLDEQLRGRREPVELDQVAMDVFRHGRTQIQAQRRDLRLVVKHLEPVSVWGDPAHIRQVALILLDNAIKYTPAGGRVSISAAREGDQAVLEMTDTGIGITQEALPHIFERFYRSDRARSHDEHGSGLGLAIARWLVESHGGEMIVRSQVGSGSTFTVRLPVLADAPDRADQTPQIAPVRPTERYLATPATAGQGRGPAGTSEAHYHATHASGWAAHLPAVLALVRLASRKSAAMTGSPDPLSYADWPAESATSAPEDVVPILGQPKADQRRDRRAAWRSMSPALGRVARRWARHLSMLRRRWSLDNPPIE